MAPQADPLLESSAVRGSSNPGWRAAEQQALRATVTELAALVRGSASAGERRAAELIAERLAQAGAGAEIQEETVRGDGYWWPVSVLAALGGAAALAALGGRRRLAAVLGGAVAVATGDELQGGPRLARSILSRPRQTWNVLARVGPEAAHGKLVVLAHHDAPHSGLIFHPRPQQWVWERWPSLIEDHDTSIPLWAPVALAPLLAALAAIAGRPGLARVALALEAGVIAVMADIARSPVVAGANDNASGVAALVALAARLAHDPPRQLEVLLVSCGSEESLQEGIRAFARRHFAELAPGASWCVNLETVGSPQLVLLEGEGPLLMRDSDQAFKDQVTEWARDAGVALRRGLRSRATTDSAVPMRAGHPTATLTSITPWKALANYHWPSDVPEHVDYGTAVAAVDAAHAVVRGLDAQLSAGLR